MKTIEEVILDLNKKKKLSFQHVPWHTKEHKSICPGKGCLNGQGFVNHTERFRAERGDSYNWMKYEVCLRCGWSSCSITNFKPWYFGERDGY